jgi:single-stranded DNA-binding protein
MSLFALASGEIVGDPVRRTSAKGSDYATALVRVGNGDATQWLSVIAFAEAATRLLSLRAGDAVSVAGRIELRSWTGRDGAERTGLSIVASEIAAARPKPRTRDGAPRQRYRRSTTRASGGGTTAPSLLADRVDDLWPGGGP